MKVDHPFLPVYPKSRICRCGLEKSEHETQATSLGTTRTPTGPAEQGYTSCILEVDSPCFSPSNNERLQCGCKMCAADLYRESVELLRSVHNWFMKSAPQHYNGCGLWIDVDEFLKSVSLISSHEPKSTVEEGKEKPFQYPSDMPIPELPEGEKS